MNGEKKSRFIVLDGLDGSGKETQTGLLQQALLAEGRQVRVFSYPRYGTPGAAAAEFYLRGGLGQRPEDTGAYAASVLFAVDRYLSYRTEWEELYQNGSSVILANRFTTANAVHHMSKLPRAEWDGFLSWLWELEFEKLAMPLPDLILYLELPPQVACRMVEQRSSETGRKKDIHEMDAGYLSRCYEAALYASDKLGWTLIRCEDGDRMRPRGEIHREIAEKVKACLPPAE
mgnify:CR=1 FL=1